MENVQQKTSLSNGGAVGSVTKADTAFDPATFRATEAVVPDVVTDDPFDPAALRLDPSSVAQIGVKQEIMECPARKPDRSWWLRTHPSPEYSLSLAVLELKEDREVFLVAPSLREQLATEPTYKLKHFKLTMTRQGKPFLWQLSLPGPDGKQPGWLTVPLDAAKKAETQWTRIAWSEATRSFEVWTATAPLPEPQWPDLPMAKLLRLAFKDGFINDVDHPVLKKLRGEV